MNNGWLISKAPVGPYPSRVQLTFNCRNQKYICGPDTINRKPPLLINRFKRFKIIYFANSLIKFPLIDAFTTCQNIFCKTRFLKLFVHIHIHTHPQTHTHTHTHRKENMLVLVYLRKKKLSFFRGRKIETEKDQVKERNKKCRNASCR